MEKQEKEFELTSIQKDNLDKLLEEGRRDVPNFYDEGECEVIYVPVEDGEIRIFHHKPNNIKTKRPILFAPGFGTTPWAWRDFHKPHHGFAEYYHLETREKQSSKIKNNCKVDFSVDRTALDISDAIKYLGLDKQDYVLFGASYCGGVVLKGLIENYFDPPTTVVFDPLCKWAYAKFMVRWVLPFMPAFVLGATRFVFAKIIMAGMKNKAQKERNMDFVTGAVPFKWRKGCLHNRRFNILNDLQKIKNEVFFFHGPSDKFHPGNTFYYYSKMIPKGRYFYMDTEPLDRELLTGVIGTAFIEITKDQGLPFVLKQFEI